MSEYTDWVNDVTAAKLAERARIVARLRQLADQFADEHTGQGHGDKFYACCQAADLIEQEATE